MCTSPSHQCSFSGPAFIVQFRTELGTYSCVCCLLHYCFYNFPQQVSRHPLGSHGGRVLRLLRLLGAERGGSPLSSFPETRPGVTGERQKELRFYLSPPFS